MAVREFVSLVVENAEVKASIIKFKAMIKIKSHVRMAFCYLDNSLFKQTSGHMHFVVRRAFDDSIVIASLLRLQRDLALGIVQRQGGGANGAG